MKLRLTFTAAILLSGCTIERIGPPGVTLTRPIRVTPDEVMVFRSAADVKGHFTKVDDVFVKDDGQNLPRVLEQELRVMAGARGANAIITAPSNRRLNSTRVDLRPTLDNPFDYFSATAIWIGDGDPPQKYLGTLGGH